MALTRDFKETIMARVRKDPKFRRALLTEAVEAFLDGDLDTGKTLLRDYINATIGFEEVAGSVGKDSKSLHRMFGPSGNPTAENIFSIIKALQKTEDISLHVKVHKRKVA